MDIDILLRFSAVALAAVLLLSTVDFSFFFKKITSLFKWPFAPKKPAIEAKEEVEFLEVIDLWYKLKHSCEVYGLKEATEKMDEVFPLLNVEK
tara:strand:+ start:13834 stop:14112 length:279 start_codon:yes stop_codon:yes gene_type:complete